MGRIEEKEYCHQIPYETTSVKRTQIGFNPEHRDRIESELQKVEPKQKYLEEALMGVTFNGSLEHVSRLVHDQLTIGRDVYSAQSWRYVRMHLNQGDLSRVHPPEAMIKAGMLSEYVRLSQISIEGYDQLVKLKIPKEDARFALLWAFDSNIVIALQGPKIVDFAIDNLNSPYGAVRQAADEVLEIFAQEFPITAEKLRSLAAKEGLTDLERQSLDYVRQPLWPEDQTMVFSWMVNNPTETTAVAARTCWQEKPPSEFVENFPIEKQRDRINEANSAGHTSVAEQPHFIVCSAMSQPGIQQLRRHRIPVQRARDMWLNAQGEYPVVVPPTIRALPEAEDIYRKVWQATVDFRSEGIKRGVTIQELDNVVMVGIVVPIFLVTNATDIIHIVRRRLCNLSQWEIRNWTYQLAEILGKTAPDLFNKMGPNCFVGKCMEPEPCGRPQDFRNWRKTIFPKEEEENK